MQRDATRKRDVAIVPLSKSLVIRHTEAEAQLQPFEDEKLRIYARERLERLSVKGEAWESQRFSAVFSMVFSWFSWMFSSFSVIFMDFPFVFMFSKA